MAKKNSEDKYRQLIKQGNYSEERMVAVTDNWFGNYEGNSICLSIDIVTPCAKDKPYRVVIMAAGNDDFWLTLQYNASSCGNAVSIFKHWKEFVYDRVPEDCNQQWFYEHGFLP